MNSRQLIEDLHRSKFRQPENFDPVKDGAGWVLYAGMNDWEAGVSGMALICPSDSQSKRIWVHVKHPGKNDQDSSDEEMARAKKHGEQAWRTWVRTAVGLYRNRNHSTRSWSEMFKAALKSGEMQQFVQEHGEDVTQWSAVVHV